MARSSAVKCPRSARRTTSSSGSGSDYWDSDDYADVYSKSYDDEIDEERRAWERAEQRDLRAVAAAEAEAENIKRGDPDSSAAYWAQAGKHVKICRSMDVGHGDEFKSTIDGPWAVSTSAKGPENDCACMCTGLVMTEGVHEVSLHAGSPEELGGHVRVGVGPPSFFSERPADLSGSQMSDDQSYYSDDTAQWADEPKDLPSSKLYLACEGAGAVVWSGDDGKVWANGKGAVWGGADDDAHVSSEVNQFVWKDRIDLRLDLGLGTLEGFKNGEPLGVICDGLRGPLCWGCELWYRGDCCLIVPSPSV